MPTETDLSLQRELLEAMVRLDVRERDRTSGYHGPVADALRRMQTIAGRTDCCHADE